jgi:hypothetical protein
MFTGQISVDIRTSDVAAITMSRVSVDTPPSGKDNAAGSSRPSAAVGRAAATNAVRFDAELA